MKLLPIDINTSFFVTSRPILDHGHHDRATRPSSGWRHKTFRHKSPNETPRRVAPRNDDDTDSNASDPVSRAGTRKCEKSVHFPVDERHLHTYYEDANEPDGNGRPFSKLDYVTALWYSAADIYGFRQQCRRDMRNLRHLEQVSDECAAWAASLQHVYDGFAGPTSSGRSHHDGDDDDEEQESRVTSHDIVADTEPDTLTLGMEKRTVASDTAQRRRYLVSQVLYWQNSALLGRQGNGNDRDGRYNETTALLLRQVSRQVTKPSRMFARYIAMVSEATPEL